MARNSYQPMICYTSKNVVDKHDCCFRGSEQAGGVGKLVPAAKKATAVITALLRGASSQPLICTCNRIHMLSMFTRGRRVLISAECGEGDSLPEVSWTLNAMATRYENARLSFYVFRKGSVCYKNVTHQVATKGHSLIPATA